MSAIRHSNKNLDRVKGSIEKLVTGLRINKGADDPANLIASERMRSNIAEIKQTHDNFEMAGSIYQHAEGSLNEISDILIRLKQLAVHATNEAVNDDAILETDQQEVDDLLATLDRLIRSTKFNGRRLLDGTMGANGTMIGDHLRFVEADLRTKQSPQEGYAIDITQVATRASKSGTVPLTVNNIGDGFFVLITESGRKAELNSRDGQLGKDIEMLLNNHEENPQRFPAEKISADIREMILYYLKKEIKENGLEIDVIEGPNSTWSIRHEKYGDEPSFSVTSNIPGIIAKQANIAEISAPGLDVQGSIAGFAARSDGQFLTAIEGTPAVGMTIQYTRNIQSREVPIYEEQPVPVYDANGEQTGMAMEKVQVGSKFVEEKQEDVVGSPENPKIEGYVHISQQTKTVDPGSGTPVGMALKDIRLKKLANGLETDSGFKSLAEISLLEHQGAKDSIKLIEKAIDEITKYRAAIGTFHKNAIKRNLETLKISHENAIESESNIRDADMAEEMSKLTSNKIMLQASQSMLSQANQLPANVIQLLDNE